MFLAQRSHFISGQYASSTVFVSSQDTGYDSFSSTSNTANHFGGLELTCVDSSASANASLGILGSMPVTQQASALEAAYKSFLEV